MSFTKLLVAGVVGTAVGHVITKFVLDSSSTMHVHLGNFSVGVISHMIAQALHTP